MTCNQWHFHKVSSSKSEIHCNYQSWMKCSNLCTFVRRNTFFGRLMQFQLMCTILFNDNMIGVYVSPWLISIWKRFIHWIFMQILWWVLNKSAKKLYKYQFIIRLNLNHSRAWLRNNFYTQSPVLPYFMSLNHYFAISHYHFVFI